jgi:hypothetical protein
MPNNKPSNINSNNNIAPKPLEVNKVNPDTGNSDISTSKNINNIQDSFRPPTSLDGKVYTNSYPQGIDAKEYKDRLGPDSTQKSKEFNKAQDLRNIDINNKINNEKSIRYGKNLNTDFLQDLAINKLRGRIESRLKGDPKSDIKPPQQVTPSPVQGASSAVQAKIQEKSKEKMMMLAARIAAWFSSFFISFMIWLIITVFALAILAALTMFILDQACGFVQQVPGGVGVPEDVKKICEYYVKLKGGCFEGSTGKKDELPLTLKCIGEDWDNKEDFVELYNAKSKINVKKQIIKEIIKAGKEAKVKDDTIYYTIAVHPLVSGDNNWKETTSNTCFGIAQFCKNSENSSYDQATNGLNIKTPEDYIKSPVLQMKSIEQYLNLKNKEIEKVPECVKKKFEGNNSVEFKIFYIWFDQACDEKNKSDGSEKVVFANAVKNNFGIIKCPKFISKLTANIDKTEFKDFSYVQNENDYKIQNENSNNQFLIYNFADHKNSPTEPFPISPKGCQLFKTYVPFIEDSLKKYKPTKQFPVLSLAIIGGLLWEESNMGTDNRDRNGNRIVNGCEGYGDEGAGHGLGQADPSSDDFPTRQKYQPIGTPVKIKYPGLPTTTVPWSDCKGGIDYAVTHKIEIAKLAEPYAIKKLQSAGMNMARKTDGVFEDIKSQKAYITLMIVSNNRGACGMAGGILCPDLQSPNDPGCTVANGGEVNESCTTNGHYGHRVLVSAVNAMKCLGKTITEEQILTDTSGTGSGGSSGVSCDPNSSTLNAQGAEFPLVTKKGTGIKIYYSQPYPEYIGGGAHRGIDVSPGSNNSNETAVISTFAGTVVAVGNVISTSCNVTCDTKSQRYVILQEDGTGLQTTAIHLNPTLAAPEVGTKVTKGQSIGRIDDFMFVHLHYETRLNGVLQNPITQIKGFNQALQASNVRAESSIIDPALYEKL